MSRVQTKPNIYKQMRNSQDELDAIQRATLTSRPAEIDTTGLSSAQIDAAVFSANAQAFDGATISDPTNNLLLLRQGGKWAKVVLTVIT